MAVNGLLILIPIALCLGIAGLLAFTWALRTGQFDDLDGAASRILFDDEPQATVAEQRRKRQSPTRGPS
jgi:cbb3-type cytochrome oxidase maturation protein